ncbi:acyloxyacyl hydrolase [Croceivirga thetidis]|uniref:Acyloxyacyl hydrolase n=1 Tax=Croceivirga thetidis TaxID=2721623 RepID=A0ABX1GNF4_9FLAO|nr:acyloxyacyl hydrolase [Croceivirga thetidis]NKI30495.1 acyloxyacyl hydrolase [Croceivirga thetidis]
MRRSPLLIALVCCLFGFAQEKKNPTKYTLDASPFYGSILLHNSDIAHLITSHPGGVILGLNKKHFGSEEWEADFNYPDTGYTFIYQNMNNPTLGEHFGVYAHYNFYFFKRNLQFRIGQGIAYNTNPYDRETNFRNSAYGSHLLSSTMAIVNFHKENLVSGLGLKTGISLIHYSNANFKAPNTSTNTFAFNLGVVYDLNHKEEIDFKSYEKNDVTEPITFNGVIRTGLNEGDVVGSGQYGFLVLSAYADKRVGRKSALQFGGDFFLSYFLKELIRFQSNSFPEMMVDGNTDFKRVGLFVGHELFINKLSLITQLGYYVYYPFDFEGRVYNRIGLKRYFGDKFFGSVTLKAHSAAAEAVEFGIGIRL